MLVGLSVVLTSHIIEHCYDRRRARLVVVLMCVSPWFLFLAMSFMNHMMTLALALLATCGLIRSKRKGRAVWCWAAGGAIGLLTFVRPLDAVICAGLMGLWALGQKGPAFKVRALAGLILGASLIAALNLLYNAHYTGQPSEFPLNAYLNDRFGPNANSLGFGADRGFPWPIDLFPGHGAGDVLANAALNLFSINVELLGWGIGSLLLVAITLFRGQWHSGDRFMFLALLLVAVLYSSYWFSGGPDFGARY